MEENKCNHEMICVEDNYTGLIGTCINCGLEINITHIKEGLYALNIVGENFLLNTVKDMNFEDNKYSFLLNNNIICLFKDSLHKEEEYGYTKKLRKYPK